MGPTVFHIESYFLPLKLFLLAMYNILSLCCSSNLFGQVVLTLLEKPVYLSNVGSAVWSVVDS